MNSLSFTVLSPEIKARSRKNNLFSDLSFASTDIKGLFCLQIVMNKLTALLQSAKSTIWKMVKKLLGILVFSFFCTLGALISSVYNSVKHWPSHLYNSLSHPLRLYPTSVFFCYTTSCSVLNIKFCFFSQVYAGCKFTFSKILNPFTHTKRVCYL